MSEAAMAYRTKKWAYLNQELLGAVQEYAAAHYNDGGWDVIVECWEDADIMEAIGWAETPKGAIAKVAKAVAVFADRQADAVNSAF